jgi:hypothetical protein
MTPEWCRDLLLKVTDRIDNEEIAGLVFASGLIISDHWFRLEERIATWLGYC